MLPQFQENTLLTSPCTSKAVHFLDSILLTTAGNRVMAYDLHANTVTQVQQARFNIKSMAVSAANIATVDDQHNLYANNKHISGKNKPVKAISYSPDGRMLAMAKQSKLHIYSLELQKIKTHSNKHKISGMAWSPDSRFVLTWGNDSTVIMNAVFSLRLYTDSMLQAHKFKIATAFFYDQKHVITVDQLGKVCLWKWVDDYLTEGYQKFQEHQKAKNSTQINLPRNSDEYTDDETRYMSEFERNAHKGRFILEKKLNIKDTLQKNFSAIKSATYHSTNLLIIGMKNGTLTLFRFDLEADSFIQAIQSLQITQTPIDSIAVNASGNWIALGMRTTGQLIVWEWRSQSYILNQQALAYENTCATMSQDLTTIATGTLGGVVRIYDFTSKFCIAKFDDQHNSKVTGIKFCPTKQGVLVTCSLDGTVRAYDTIRLKCFRVMQPEIPNQLHCLDIEPTGELICVGGFDPYEIYVFSLQTGQLVEVLAGHQAPVNCMRFIQTSESVLLLTGSWDKTIRVHDLFARGNKEGSGGDVMQHNSEVTAIAAKGKEVAVATMGGELVMWDIKDNQILYSFDVHRDIQGGRISKDMLAAQMNQNLKYFNALEFSKDGQYLIGAGNSKFMCLYDTKFRILVRKFVLSNNYSLDGMKLKINFSTINQENAYIEQSDDEYQQANLPGAKSYDVSKRSTKRIGMHVTSIEFSQSNRQFIVVHSEGVAIYGPSTRKKQVFDPLMIDETISVEEIQKQVDKQSFGDALILCLKLNQQQITQDVFNCIPMEEIHSIVSSIPEQLVIRLIETIITSMEQKRQIERNLFWVKTILIEFAHLIKQIKVISILQELLKHIKLDFNKITIPISKCINQIDYMLLNQDKIEIETQ